MVRDVYCMEINHYISPACWGKQMAMLDDVIVDIRIGQTEGYCLDVSDVAVICDVGIGNHF